jgi:hypothetical protein
MTFLEERFSLWENFKNEYNFYFIKKEDIKNLDEKIDKNLLILPFPYEDEYLKILRNFALKDIYSEVLNLFYFIKREFDFFDDKVYKYILDHKNDILTIKVYDFKLKEVKEFNDRVFTPIGIKEYLSFNGFKVKDLWGDIPKEKIRENDKFITLRFEKL